MFRIRHDECLNVGREPRGLTNGKPTIFFIFRHETYGRFCTISVRYIAQIKSLEQKPEQRRLSICWLVHNQLRMKKLHLNSKYRRGRSPSTALAVAWLAQLVCVLWLRVWHVNEKLVFITLGVG